MSDLERIRDGLTTLATEQRETRAAAERGFAESDEALRAGLRGTYRTLGCVSATVLVVAGWALWNILQ